MAILEVNSTQINFDEKSHFNLKSLIPKLQKNFPFDQYTFSNLKMNGESVELNDDNFYLTKPFDHNDVIQISINEINNQAIEMLEDLSQLTDKILDQIQLATDLLKNDSVNQAEMHLLKTIEAIDLFIQGVTYSYHKLYSDQEDRRSLPIKDLHIHLLSVIKAISSAQVKQDLIMLTDLLEYELKDNLTQWKILIIPSLKKQAQVPYQSI